MKSLELEPQVNAGIDLDFKKDLTIKNSILSSITSKKDKRELEGKEKKVLFKQKNLDS